MTGRPRGVTAGGGGGVISKLSFAVLLRFVLWDGGRCCKEFSIYSPFIESATDLHYATVLWKAGEPRRAPLPPVHGQGNRSHLCSHSPSYFSLLHSGESYDTTISYTITLKLVGCTGCLQLLFIKGISCFIIVP